MLYINNWDLVDLSAPKIPGKYLLNNKAERKLLYKLAVNDNLWYRRIAIISTFAFIKNREYKDTLRIAEILLRDKHDLIHKYKNDIGHFVEFEIKHFKKCFNFTTSPRARKWLEKFVKESMEN